MEMLTRSTFRRKIGGNLSSLREGGHSSRRTQKSGRTQTVTNWALSKSKTSALWKTPFREKKQVTGWEEIFIVHVSNERFVWKFLNHLKLFNEKTTQQMEAGERSEHTMKKWRKKRCSASSVIWGVETGAGGWYCFTPKQGETERMSTKQTRVWSN